MQLFVKEKAFSIHNRYFIYNSDGEIEYEIESKAISIGDNTTVYDKNHNEVAFIEQELLHLMPYYNVYINNKLEFKINKKIALFENNYVLSNNFKVSGSALNLKFAIEDSNGKCVANISREFLSLPDKYKIDIHDETKIVTILCIIVAITNDVDRAQNSH